VTVPTDTQLESLQRLFTDQDLQEVDASRVPRHIAIIPDGNRRWAELQKENLEAGHLFGGTKVLFEAVQAAAELGVRVVTFYAFSTENWNRSDEEVGFLMELLKQNLVDYSARMLQHGVRLQTIGDLSTFNQATQDLFTQVKDLTRGCTTIDLVLAVNYGSRNELCRAAQSLARECQEGQLDPAEIDEERFSQHLDTTPWGDPELLIRTSGEWRLSNFLLWQLCYCELYVTETLWPDFRSHNMLAAIKDYQRRKRRFGQ